MRKLCLLLLFALLIPLVSADTISLRADAEENSYVTDGDVRVVVYVENPSEIWDVSGVTVSAAGAGFSFSYNPSSATIAANSTPKKFTITVTGLVWEDTKVYITASAPDTADYEVNNKTISVTIKPPEAKIEILTPGHEIKKTVDNASAEQSVSFDITVKNVGDADLVGLGVSAEFDNETLECAASGSSDIPRTKTAKYSAGCNGVNNNEQMFLRFVDSLGLINQTYGVRFKFEKKFVFQVNISEGGENRSYGEVMLPSAEAGPKAWPMFRGNPMRTGFSNGTGDLNSDFVVSWTYSAPNGVFGSPAAADLNKDGLLEIVVPLDKNEGTSQKNLLVLSSTGTLLWSISTKEGIHSSPAIADVDGDGDLDIIVGTNGGDLLVLDGQTGSEVWKVQKPGGFFRSSALAYDVDGDGNVEVVVGSNDGVHAFDGESSIEEWFYPTDGEVSSSVALGNLDSDTGLEVAFGSEHGIFYILDAESGGLVGYADLGSPVIYSTPVITASGKMAIGTDGGLMDIISGGDVSASFSTNASISGSPGVIPGGTTRIVFGAAQETDIHGQYQTASSNGVYCVDESGRRLWYLSTKGWSVFSSPALADIDRDGVVEVVVGSREGRLYAINSETGKEEWNYYDGTGLFASPALADIDNDGDLEIIVGYRFSNQIKVLDSPKKPDIIVDAIAFSNEFPEDREDIEINVTVKNIGKSAVGDFNVTIYRRSDILDHPLANLTFGSLAVGESRTLRASWKTQFPQGRMGIYAEADTGGAVDESDETNNGKYKEFGNDLFMTSYVMPTINKVDKKTSTKASAVVKNIGRLDLVGVEVAVVVDNNGNVTELARRSLDIERGKEGSVEVPFDYTPITTQQKLVIVIDPDNKIEEVDELNNRAEIIVEPPEPVVVPPEEKGEGMPINPIIIILVVFVGIIVAIKVKSMKKVKKKKGGEEKLGKRLVEIKGAMEGTDDESISSGYRSYSWQPAAGSPETEQPQEQVQQPETTANQEQSNWAITTPEETGAPPEETGSAPEETGSTDASSSETNPPSSTEESSEEKK